MTETIFDKIINKEIPADIVFEDEHCLAFKDVNPQAPIHILIIPKIRIAKVADATGSDKNVLGHLLVKAGEIAEDLGVKEAFRLVINNGDQAGQTVFHLHVHLMAGRPFRWPPG